MVSRRAAHGRYQDLLAWLHEGEQLATDFPGYLGSGILAPPADGDEFQIIFRFSDEPTLHAWEHSASRRTWLQRGNGLFERPKEARQRHRRLVWHQHGAKTAALEAGRGHLAGVLPGIAVQPAVRPLAAPLDLLPRVLLSTLALTPLMVYLFIPLSTRLLAGWLNAARARPHRAPAQPLRPATQGGAVRVCWGITTDRQVDRPEHEQPHSRYRSQPACRAGPGP
jgi:antibiotic biosynthesis monooxygenase (ABM) superfamily enzyme